MAHTDRHRPWKHRNPFAELKNTQVLRVQRPGYLLGVESWSKHLVLLPEEFTKILKSRAQGNFVIIFLH